jgi:hypothetical protein
MCWQLGTSYTTADFIDGGGGSGPVGSYSKLQPGDALVRRSNGAGHIVLFLGWNDSSRTAACVIEQASRANDMQFRARSTSSLQASGFKAIRADDLSADSTPAPTPDDEPISGAGQRCTGSGDCNPGNDGSGLICVGGYCEAGCVSDSQCPGVKTCIGGQCR